MKYFPLALQIFFYFVQVSSLKLRLTGSDVKGYIQHGYLEVFHKGRWGAVCADGWGDKDSYVACGNLGYPNAKVRDFAAYEKNAVFVHTPLIEAVRQPNRNGIEFYR